MSTVLLVGAFGQRNPGDEALLSAFRQGLSDWQLLVSSANPDATVEEHGIRALDGRDPAAVAKALAFVDGVVVGGGTVFKVLPRSTRRLPSSLMGSGTALLRASSACGLPTALVAVGAGALPRRRHRWLARQFASAADMLIMRDEESVAALRAAGVRRPLRVGADASWLLWRPPGQDVSPSVDRTPSGPIMVAVSHLAGVVPDEVSLGLAQVGRDVVLVPWQRGGHGLDDVDVALQMEGRLRRLGVPVEVTATPASFQQAVTWSSGASVVIGQRFHGLVAAAMAGTRFVAVRHEPKLTALARRFDQPAVDAGATRNQFAQAVRDAIEGPPPSVKMQRDQAQKAHAQMADVRALLTGARTAQRGGV